MLAWSGSACFLHVSTTGPFPWVQDHKGRYCRPPLRHQPNLHTHIHTHTQEKTGCLTFVITASSQISLFLEAPDKLDVH